MSLLRKEKMNLFGNVLAANRTFGKEYWRRLDFKLYQSRSESGKVLWQSCHGIMTKHSGGLEAAKYLLGSDNIQTGFFELWRLNRLDLTVEYLAAYKSNKKFALLFTIDELQRAKNRLKDHEYKV